MVVNPGRPRDKGGIVSVADQPAMRREFAARCSAP
jgi:hypothetical protein